jgi:hypothetical protein
MTTPDQKFATSEFEPVAGHDQRHVRAFVLPRDSPASEEVRPVTADRDCR